MLPLRGARRGHVACSSQACHGVWQEGAADSDRAGTAVCGEALLPSCVKWAGGKDLTCRADTGPGGARLSPGPVCWGAELVET